MILTGNDFDQMTGFPSIFLDDRNLPSMTTEVGRLLRPGLVPHRRPAWGISVPPFYRPCQNTKAVIWSKSFPVKIVCTLRWTRQGACPHRQTPFLHHKYKCNLLNKSVNGLKLIPCFPGIIAFGM